jgi:hypothetical protein
MLQDKFAIAWVVAVELKAGLADDQGLEQRLALGEWHIRDVAAVQMQDVETVVDDMNAALAVACGLGLGEARQAVVVDAQSSPSR